MTLWCDATYVKADQIFSVQDLGTIEVTVPKRATDSKQSVKWNTVSVTSANNQNCVIKRPSGYYVVQQGYADPAKDPKLAYLVPEV